MAATSRTTEEPVRRPTTRYNADIRKGLTAAQVEEYMENGWDNHPVEPPSKTISEIIRSNVITYFNIIFAVIAVLLIVCRSFKSLTFLPIILLNTLIGIIQEIQAKKTLEKLTVMNAAKARVIRDGKIKNIRIDQLVLDDIVVFESGNQICADAIVLQGEVQANEALLTGESDEITKKSGDHLMSGSFVVSGKCIARLEKVGEDSYINKLTLEAKKGKDEEQSEMIRSLNKLLLIVGILIIPVGIMLFYQNYFVNSLAFTDSITTMVAAVIGMIPEGLFLLSSITLASSVVKLAMKKVLVHDMKCIETLARVNVLCVDKTGTITENTMVVNDIIPLDGFDEADMISLEQLVCNFSFSMSSDNITMAALKERFKGQQGEKADSITSFSSAFKYSSATFGSKSYVLGAPEFILKDQYENYKQQIDEQGGKGYRVLVFAQYNGTPTGKELTESSTALGLVLLSNPIRKDAKATFEYFAEQGVEVKVISGDNPVTVSVVAGQAGIRNTDSYIDASTLKSKSDILAAVQKYTVFGRVTPDQKRMIVQCLKKIGKTVAMTGDGVNDVLALKDADCSVAMASGSEAAAQASQLVLLESDFARMPDVVQEGRQVVNNLERSGSLFLVKNIFSLLMSAFSIIFSITYPLQPAQITLISMFTIGLPGFFLSQTPNKKLIRGHFISNILLRALQAGITDALIVGALVIFGNTFNVGSVDISTACTILLAIVGFMILYRIIRPMDKFKWIVFIGSIGGLLFSSVFLPNIFGITEMSTRCIMLFVLFSIATVPVFRFLTWIVISLRKLYLKLTHNQHLIDQISDELTL